VGNRRFGKISIDIFLTAKTAKNIIAIIATKTVMGLLSDELMSWSITGLFFTV
jgi:hypothetical protein